MLKKTFRHILELTSVEKREFINSFDIVLTDCDGVLWQLIEPIKGAGEAINLLKDAGKQVVYITNNSVRSLEGYKKNFDRAGVTVDLKNDLVHPAASIVYYLNSIKFEGLIYCIATMTLKDHLRSNGYQVIDGPNKILEESFTELARHVIDNEPVRAVVVDVDFNLSAPKLIRAGLYLNRPECIYICGATDMMLPVGKNVQIIGPGPYIKILESSYNKQPIVLGKPGHELGNMLLKRYSIKNVKRALFIGDMLEQDIGFGNSLGFQTLVVLTGGAKKEQLIQHDKEHEIPDYYAESMADFVKFFQDI